MSDDIPRRIRLDFNTPAELAIRAAVDAVEALPADVRLTDAVVLLGKARECVADFVDNVPRADTEGDRPRDNLQRGLSRLDPMQRSSPETLSCVFCGADKGHSYVTGDRTPHAETCEWRRACEARGIPWDHVL